MSKYETLKADMTTALKEGNKVRRLTIADMVASIDKASVGAKSRAIITDQLVDEVLLKYRKTVKEMIVAQYAENATKAIEEIYAQPSAKELSEMKNMILAEMYKDIANLPEAQAAMMKQQINIGFVAQNWATKTGMDMQSAMAVLSTMSAEQFNKVFEQTITESATQLYAQYSGMTSVADKNAKVVTAFEKYLADATNEDYIYFYDNHMPDKASDKTQSEVLKMLGTTDITDPDFIYIYPINFEMKDKIADMIDDYNASATEENKIEYTDMAAMLMSSVSSIITAISVVLICFVSISLVVSSIMIGIITYISVYERTKEIGILRAIGASKHNISSIFNAETFIIGLLSGLFGIGVTYALIPIICDIY